MTLKAQVLSTGLPGPWPLSGPRPAPPAALWLWNQIGAVTSTYSDQCDLCSSPRGVLSEPGIDTPGAEKVFFCRERFRGVSAHQQRFLWRWRIGGWLVCMLPQAEHHTAQITFLKHVWQLANYFYDARSAIKATFLLCPFPMTHDRRDHF